MKNKIGTTYSIIENGSRLVGEIVKQYSDSGSYLVKWDDGTTTLETEIDSATC